MASNTVNLGIGYSGMMYMADAGVSLPASPLDTLTDFTEVGAISYDGITVNFAKDSDPIRDWTKAIRRLASSEEGASSVAVSATVTASVLLLSAGATAALLPQAARLTVNAVVNKVMTILLFIKNLHFHIPTISVGNK